MISTPPSSEAHPAGQYQVVAACDLSALGDRAVEEALQLCVARPHAALHVITVAAPHAHGVVLPGETRVLAYAQANEIASAHLASTIDRCCAGASRIGLEKVALYLTPGEPAASICSLANAVDADVIVLGTHDRRGLGRMLHGSVTGEVMRRATCGVLVLRPRDFLDGEKLPEIQPPLQPGEHPLLPFRMPPTYHYVPRASRPPSRLMPAL